MEEKDKMAAAFKSKANQIIRSFNSEDNSCSGISIISSFGIKTEINVDTLQVGEFYSEVLELTSQSNLVMIEDNNHETSTEHGLPFCEKVTDRVPIIIDMTFQFPDTEALSFYDADFIIRAAKIIQQVVSDTIICQEEEDKELVCFVLESNIWAKERKQFQKLRFQFPYTGISTKILNSWIISEVITDLTASDLLKSLHATPTISDWNQIISKVENFIPMYGSKEREDVCPLYLRSVFSSILDYDVDDREITNETNEDFYLGYEETDWIDPMDCSLVKQCMLDRDNFLENQKDYNLPLMLSIHFYGKYSQVKKGAIMLTEPKKSVVVSKKTGFMLADDNVHNIYDELISLISPDKTSPDYRYYWYSIGKVTHNLYGGSRMGLDKFISISHEKLKGECEEVWETFSNEYLDNRTLMEYVKDDDPEAFARWHRSYYEPYIEQALRGKNMCVADLAKRVLILDFVYDRENKLWYRKKQSRLVKDTGCCELRESIRNKLKTIYYEIRKERERQRDEAETSERKKIFNSMVREVDNLIDKLDDVDFLDKIIKALTSKMFDDNLTRLKDENLNTIACTNVVLECYDETICHRPGKIQDYITKCTNCAFPISYTKETRQVKFLLKYFSQVHCEPELYYDGHDHKKLCHSIFCEDGFCHGEMCHFVFKDNASVLLGGNEEKRFRNLIGESNASKSQIMKLFQEALGEYCVDFPNEAITVSRTKTSGGPDPALEQAKGARMAIVAETDKSEPIHVAKIKKYTGGDRYWNRSLNKEGGSRALTFKLFHMSNVIADRPNADEAYEMREVIYPHLSKWISNPPADEIEQYRQRRFKMDLGFSKKIKSLAQAMLWLMYTYFPIYKKEGIRNLPAIVKQKTDEHQLEVNPYYNFIKEKINREIYVEGEEENKILDDSKTLSVYEVFQQYRRWYPTFSPDTILNVNQTSFKNEMTRQDRLGKLNEFNEWVGVSIRMRAKAERAQ